MTKPSIQTFSIQFLLRHQLTQQASNINNSESIPFTHQQQEVIGHVQITIK